MSVASGLKLEAENSWQLHDLCYLPKFCLIKHFMELNLLYFILFVLKDEGCVIPNTGFYHIINLILSNSFQPYQLFTRSGMS